MYVRTYARMILPQDAPHLQKGRFLICGGSTVAGVAGAAIVERPQMVIKQSGNVGIATTSPIAQLDVAGNTNQRHSVSTTHNGGWRSIQNLGVTGWLDQTYSAGRLKVFE